MFISFCFYCGRAEIKDTDSELSNLLEKNSNKNNYNIAFLKEKLEKIYKNKYEGFLGLEQELKKLDKGIPDEFFFEKEKYKCKVNIIDKIRTSNN